MGLPDHQHLHDVVIIGAGPAGCTAAALLAQRGYDVLLLEREPIRRHHVGESLIPAVNPILEKLDVVDQLQRSHYPKKFSVQFVGAAGKASDPFYFDEHEPLGLGHTWQVVRSDFDAMLSRRAQQLGARLLDKTRVTGVDTTSQGRVLVEICTGKPQSGRTERIAARVVVDASGQSSFIASRMGIRRRDPRLRNGTVWTWYRGAQRDRGRDEGATIIYSSADHRSWFWFIPLPDDIVSIGCTGSMDWMFGKRESAEQILDRELGRCPALKSRLSAADRVEAVRATKDFSYSSRRCAGDRWVLIGDAYGFIDPVYSSGVFLAMKSAELAVQSIDDALRCDHFSADRLGAWQRHYDSGVDCFRRLVYAFYDPQFSFAKFVAADPGRRRELTELLVGNVFRPGAGRILETMSITPQ